MSDAGQVNYMNVQHQMHRKEDTIAGRQCTGQLAYMTAGRQSIGQLAYDMQE